MRNRPRPIFCSQNFSEVATTPSPYFTLRKKLIDDAWGKYLVGQDTYPRR